MRTIFSAKKKIIATPEAIDIGGTNGASLQTAMAALGGIKHEELDVANGLAILGNDSKVKPINIPPLAFDIIPTVYLPVTSTEVGTIVKCVITNYDSRRTYTVSPIGTGTAVLKTYDDLVQCVINNGGDLNFNNNVPPPGVTFNNCVAPGTILYTAPNTVEAGGFILNGVTYDIAVTPLIVAEPFITFPANNSVASHPSLSVGADAPYIALFGYAVAYKFQIAENINFTLNVGEYVGGALTSGVSSHTFLDLIANKLYYIRAQYGYNDGAGGTIWSDWSPVISVATPSEFVLSETQLLSANPPEINGWFGWSVETDDTGDRIVVGSNGSGTNTGSAYVFHRNGNNWTQETKLTHVAEPTDDGFGVFVSMSGDGNYIAIGTQQDYASGTSAGGAVYIFKRSGTSWNEEQKIILSDVVNTGRSDACVSLNHDGTKLIIGSYNAPYSIGQASNCGAAYIFTRTNVTWSQEIKLIASDYANGAQFGYRVLINDAGDRVIVSAPYALDSTLSKVVGKVYVFYYNGSAWVEEAILFDDSLSNNAWFGGYIASNVNTDTLVIGASWSNENTHNNAGSVYIYSRVGNVWSQSVKLIDDISNPSSDQFGSGVAINNTGTQLTIGAAHNDNGLGVLSGVAYIYKNINETWTKVQTLKPSNAQPNTYFGESICCNDDSSIIMFGVQCYDVTSIQDSGAVYIFM